MAHTHPLIDYLSDLTLSGGDHDGAPFVVLPWEKRFIRGTFRQSKPAAVSIARGNGKSALVAGIAAAVVDPEGPLHGNRREVVCAASSFSQGRIIFEDVLAFMKSKHDTGNRKVWRLQDSQNMATLEYRATGARVRCIGSDPKRAHGLRPYLALLDEPSQWDPAKSEKMLAAIKTGLGKVPGSRMICLGTKPADDSHWFSRMLAGEGCGYSQVHAARSGDPDFQRRTIRRANPSYDHLPSLRAELADEIEAARTDPAMLAAWRALRLNMGTSDTVESMLLAAETWVAAEGDAQRTGPCVWGIDLGATQAQSAIAAYWPDSGRIEALAAFPAMPDLSERGLRDGVGRLYTDCFRRGELIQCGGHNVNVSELLSEALERFGPPVALAADRWRDGELKDALQAARIPMAALELRGQGFKDGAEDVRAFRRAIADGRAVPVKSLLLRASMASARCAVDPAGNSKLAKGTEAGRRLRAKDDAVAAAILAVSLGSRRKPVKRRRLRYALAG